MTVDWQSTIIAAIAIITTTTITSRQRGKGSRPGLLIGCGTVASATLLWIVFSRSSPLTAEVYVITAGVGLTLYMVGYALLFTLPREQSPVPNQVAKASTLPHPSPSPPAPQSVTRRTPEAPRMVERPPSTYRYPERSDPPLPTQRYPGLAELPLPIPNSPEPPDPSLPIPNSPDDEYHSTSAIAEGPGTFRIITDRRHRDELCNAIKQARSELTIVSPWVSHRGLDEHIRQLLITAMRRGVTVRIGWGYPTSSPQQIQEGKSVLNLLRQGISPQLRTTKLVIEHVATHEKLVICDDRFCIWGSFNWLSNDGESTYRRETSSYSERPGDIALWKAHATTLFGLKDGRRSW